MCLKLEIKEVMLNVVSAYAPQVGCQIEKKKEFWSKLYKVLACDPKVEGIGDRSRPHGPVGERNSGW